MMIRASGLALFVALALPACGGGRPAFTDAALAARFERLRPAVEKALGAPLPRPLVFRVATRGWMAASVRNDLARYADRFPGSPLSSRLPVSQKTVADALARGLLAKLDLETGTIRVSGSAFRFVSRANSEFEDVRTEGFLDFVLIHESIHAFQNESRGLHDFLDAAQTYEEYICRSSVIEGHAQHISEKVAKDLDLSASYDLFVRTNTDTPSTVEDPAARTLLKIANSRFTFQYVDGQRLVDAVVAKLGHEAAFDRLFAAPPAKLRLVTRPEEYLSGKRRGVEISTFVGPIRGLFDAANHTFRTSTTPLPTLKAAVLGVTREEVDKGFAGYCDSVSIIAAPRSGPFGHLWAMVLIEFETPENARAFTRMEEKAMRAKDKMLSKKGGMARITKVTYDEPGVEGAPGTYTDKTVEINATGQTIRSRSVATCRGPIAIELNAIGIDTTREEIVDLVRRIFLVLDEKSLEGSAK